MSEKIIHIIPARTDLDNPSSKYPEHHKLKVAAYARVSTGSTEQLNSLYNQINHYTEFIKKNKSWRLVGIYSDEGISGLSAEYRKGFNRMLAEAMAGEIDLIVTKSISRFARNIVDAISTIRQLKAHGVDVFFERENIHTMDSKSEFILSILSSVAQEESRSISENITWGIRKNMARGKVSFPYSNFLGYARGANGTPVVIEEEAKVVRRIFSEFLDGFSMRDIAARLEADQILTPSRKNYHWGVSSISSILHNEKYKGDALLQKVYTVDFLTGELRQNNGQLPQYYIENSHPAIITADIFDQVQYELKLRAGACGHHKISPLYNMIECANCGAKCRRITRYSYLGVCHYSWICPKCPSLSVYEEKVLAVIKASLRADGCSVLTRRLVVASIEKILMEANGKIKVIRSP